MDLEISDFYTFFWLSVKKRMGMRMKLFFNFFCQFFFFFFSFLSNFFFSRPTAPTHMSYQGVVDNEESGPGLGRPFGSGVAPGRHLEAPIQLFLQVPTQLFLVPYLATTDEMGEGEGSGLVERRGEGEKKGEKRKKEKEMLTLFLWGMKVIHMFPQGIQDSHSLGYLILIHHINLGYRTYSIDGSFSFLFLG